MNKRVRLFVIVEYFPPRLGGDKRIYELLKRLSLKRYEMIFIALPPSYTLFMAEIDKEPPHDLIIEIGRIRGITVGYPKVFLKLWRKNFILSYIMTIIYIFLKVIILVIKYSPNLIIVNNTSVYTGLIGYVLSLIANINLLVDFNDLASEYTFEKIAHRIPQKLHSVTKLVLRLVEDAILKRSNKIITVHSHFLEKYAKDRFKKKILYIPDGVDLKQFNYKKINLKELKILRRKLKIENNKICIYAGRIDKNIGGYILYNVLKQLEENVNINNKIKCIILGEGDQDLISQVKNLNSVIYLGLKPPQDVPKYIALADIVLVPYPITKASHSVSPLKMFEGLAMAKPVLASKIWGIKDVIKNNYNGILVDNDPEEWVRAIRKVIEDKSLREKLIKNALNNIKKYDWKFLSDKFEYAIKIAICK